MSGWLKSSSLNDSRGFRGTVTAQSEFVLVVLFSFWDATLARSVLLPALGNNSLRNPLVAVHEKANPLL